MAPPAGPAGEPLTLADYEALARARLPHAVYEYVASGAGDEWTVRWNREAYDAIRLRPRVLRDVTRVDTRVRLLGAELPFPILLAPAAYHGLLHPEAERETARGAGRAGATLVVSTGTNTEIEAIAAEAAAPLWFQLYVQADRGFTGELVRRAEAAGCAALCLTVDTPVLGSRDRQRRAGFGLPPGLRTPYYEDINSGLRAASAMEKEAITWRDVEWLLSVATVPVLLKGVLSPEDAELAVEAGAAGIVVSNHGGRNLDTLPATIEALPEVTEVVAGRVPLLVDGGIRRGTDVLKALALGASAVLVGRPYLYGLAVAGAAGVARVVEILRTELEHAMALTGHASVEALDASVIRSNPVNVG
jgi:4-hydroxymandelate oxidase